MARIAVVTGASSGMGRLSAELLAKKITGLDEIWLVARRAERLEALKERLCSLAPGDSGETKERAFGAARRKCGGDGKKKSCGKRRKPLSVRILAMDLTKEQSFSLLQERLQAERPEIWFLINAAGFGKIGAVSSLSEETETKMLRLNCEALLRLCRILLPYMAKDRGRIVNFASAAAFLPQPGFSVYAASKAFVLSLSEALSEELRGQRIAVTAVCPGPVKTEFFDIAEETGALPLYKRMVMADAACVCEKALTDSLKRRRVSVYGASMKGFHLLSRLMPHRLFFFCMRMLNKGGKRG